MPEINGTNDSGNLISVVSSTPISLSSRASPTLPLQPSQLDGVITVKMGGDLNLKK
jgi:hypothetical protein